jgi:hypothetical protein
MIEVLVPTVSRSRSSDGIRLSDGIDLRNLRSDGPQSQRRHQWTDPLLISAAGDADAGELERRGQTLGSLTAANGRPTRHRLASTTATTSRRAGPRSATRPG